MCDLIYCILAWFVTFISNILAIRILRSTFIFPPLCVRQVFALHFFLNLWFTFRYDLSNGIQQSEVGTITGKGTENEVLKVQGFYSFVAPDGKRYIVRYTADENGFVPSITETENTDDQSKLEQSLSEFPDNIGTALLATLNGGWQSVWSPDVINWCDAINGEILLVIFWRRKSNSHTNYLLPRYLHLTVKYLINFIYKGYWIWMKYIVP